MARRSFGLPTLRGAAPWLTVGLVALSVVVALVDPLRAFVPLYPGAVLQGWVWQLLSYVLLENSPFGVLFGAYILWTIGGDLERQWGPARLVRFVFGVGAAAAVATVLLSLLWVRLQAVYFYGGGVVMTSLLVAWGLGRPFAQVNFFGIGMTGRQFALVAAAFVGLSAAFAGLGAVVPDAFALLFTWLVSKGWGPGDWLTRLRSWAFSRQLKKRASQFEVISGDKRNMPKDSDRYLH